MVSACAGEDYIDTAWLACYCKVQAYEAHICHSLEIGCSLVVATVEWLVNNLSACTKLPKQLYNTFCSFSFPIGKLKDLYLLFFFSLLAAASKD